MELYCRDLYFTYPGQSAPIFQGLTWTMEGPGFLSFFGFSGVGKSTLARLLSGDATPDRGTIGLRGGVTTLYAHNAERLPGWGKVGDHLRDVTPRGKEELLSTLIETCRIDRCLDKGFNGLSMGQKNRVNITRYLVQEFDLLVLDEVLANVDEPTRNHILVQAKRLFPAKTFVYISHNVLEVARFSKEVLILPQALEGVISQAGMLPGLDHHQVDEGDPELLQQAVFRILRVAGSGGGGS